MKCKLCGNHEAVICVQKIVGNIRIEICVCEECARKEGARKEGVGDSQDAVELSLSKLINSMDIRERIPKSPKKKECSTCGTSYEEFKSNLKFGCSECYSVFQREIRAYFRRHIGRSKHRGKIPGSLLTRQAFLFDINNLRRELKKALQDEEYERAAELRDKINSLKHISEDRS